MAMNMISINISLLFVIFSFLLLPNDVNSLSFNFPTFVPHINAIPLTLEGDATVTDGSLQLTKVDENGIILPNGAGRASYSEPVRLWDPNTGKAAGFITSFTFVVEPIYIPAPFGDGISFFIAPFFSHILNNSSGGFLGLFSADSALNATLNQIIAVEFDSFPNQWDPSSRHVGININSIASNITTAWQGDDNILFGSMGVATVSYDPWAKNLSASITNPGSTMNGSYIIVSFEVELKTVLPEWVRVGFAGATGDLVESQKIFS